ncbi:MAG: AAA family ATPase [Chloroflexi bacterium]|nr:AAA family ATPase [Chloroflexota bacterium]
MSTTVAVAGKGGTGKTTISSLLAKLLAEKGTVLAIDADPSVNLYMALGLETPSTIGDIREDLLDAAHLPPGMNKYEYMDLAIRGALVESKGIDLLAMGRPEGAGCYCAANHILRQAIDSLANAYDYVVIDNEAGMEHISRQTTRDVNTLLLVSDPTVRGVTAAGRMQELIQVLRTKVDQIYLVVNRVNGAIPPEVEKTIKEQGLSLLATIPSDEGVGELDALGRPLVELPSDSPVRKAVQQLAHDLGLAKLEEPVKAGLPANPAKSGMGKP